MDFKEHIEPKEVFSWFYRICEIPHGSGNMNGISSFLESFAKDRGLNYIRDEHNNIIIKKNGTNGYENALPVILQGHLDMVCEKKEDVSFDFLKDSLKLIKEDDFLKADGTTLGADNGIAVAYILAILDASDISHPPVEAIFTVDEEIGLIGANLIDLSSLKSKCLINIDSEDEGIFTVSCAGGATVTCRIPVSYKEENGIVYKISVEGLKGGHSGIEIDKNRGNSNILMGRLLNRINLKEKVKVSEISGGLKDNAIPVKTTAIIVADNEIDDYIKEYDLILKNEYKTSDSDVKITFEKINKTIKCADQNSSNSIIYLLTALPDGIQKMSAEIKDLPETSLNMGIVKLCDNTLNINLSVRSSVDSEKNALIEKIRTITEFAGGDIEVSGIYSGWEYNKNSDLRRIFVDVYKKMYLTEPQVEAIHAGLECGVFCEKIKGLDCISFGPDIFDVHTPGEKISISSAKRTWEFLKEILRSMK